MYLCRVIIVSFLVFMGSTTAHPNPHDDNPQSHSLHIRAAYPEANPYSNTPLLQRHPDHDLHARHANGARDKDPERQLHGVDVTTRTKCLICGTRCRSWGPKHPLCPYHMHLGVTCGPMVTGEKPQISPPKPHQSTVSVPAGQSLWGIPGPAVLAVPE